MPLKEPLPEVGMAEQPGPKVSAAASVVAAELDSSVAAEEDSVVAAELEVVSVAVVSSGP